MVSGNETIRTLRRPWQITRHLPPKVAGLPGVFKEKIMRNTVAKKLRNEASKITLNTSKDNSLKLRIFDKFFWRKGKKIKYQAYTYNYPEGSFRRVYQDLKKEYYQKAE